MDARLRAIALAALFFAATAQAEPYLRAGNSHVKTHGGSANTVELAVGYSFGDLSIELGSFQPGTLKESFVTTHPNSNKNYVDMDRWSLNGYSLSAKFALPVTERLSAFASAGAYRLKTHFESVRITLEGPLWGVTDFTSSSSRSQNTVPGFGVGAQYSFTKNFAAYVSVKRVNLKAGMVAQEESHLNRRWFRRYLVVLTGCSRGPSGCATRTTSA